jgi:hypothetical protein
MLQRTRNTTGYAKFIAVCGLLQLNGKCLLSPNAIAIGNATGDKGSSVRRLSQAVNTCNKQQTITTRGAETMQIIMMAGGVRQK